MRAEFSDGDACFADGVDHMIAARYCLPMLISAPTGSAVRRVACRVHEVCFGSAPRPFIEQDAAALPSSPAAFTTRWRELTSEAAGGTLLLTDIEATPVPIQHALAEGLMFNARLDRAERLRPIAGTTVRLFDRVVAGAFSQALFYRVNVIHLVIGDDDQACSP
jgi:DNA-binding NtrC family response regulator